MLFEIVVFIVIILLLFTPTTVKHKSPSNRQYYNNHQTFQRQNQGDETNTFKKGTKVIVLKSGHELEIIDSTKNDELYILKNKKGDKVFREKSELEKLD